MNSRPFIYGLNNFLFSEPVNISEDIPSACADKLINDEADIGLVPVAALPFLNNYEIISDYCIGADGEVKSVLLLSDVPVEEIKTVLLDYQSRTSINLTRVLFMEYWNTSPEFISANPGYENDISGTTAGVVIGDRALELKGKFKFAYDLSLEWKKMTSLPFVFACWISTKKLTAKFINEFNEALAKGLKNIDVVASNEQSSFLSTEDITNYLKQNIDYNFDQRKKEALDLFLHFIESRQKV